ncbi:acetyl esterase [Williamsia limnetica]|uniref:Acetyl esterase n=2 Tax=Williamsia limnetica TaxID=882452 RepID=A0A318RBC2_WILLI|nr:acetyl esterase [Williamsia limnetica]
MKGPFVTTVPMPLRTRAFGVLLKKIAKEPTTPDQMIALRIKREKLLSTGVGRFVCGADSPNVEVDEVIAEIEGRAVRLRIHRPIGAVGTPPIVVNYHGGGWCLGSPEQSRWMASRVAERAGAVVVSPVYRLAPEHPFPAAVDDACGALQWIGLHAADLGGDPGRIAVMGDSAGGNLATVAALAARDAGGPELRGQVLIYPAVEMYERWPSEDENADAPVLTSSGMHTFTEMYLAADHGTEDWRASPIRAASHEGLSPVLILTAGHDPLRDHGRHYREVLQAAGVRVELIDYPDTVHGFAALPGVAPTAHTALGDIVAFLKGVF